MKCADLIAALKRIADHEVRANRAGRRLVDIDEVNILRRIARLALEKRQK